MNYPLTTLLRGFLRIQYIKITRCKSQELHPEFVQGHCDKDD